MKWTIHCNFKDLKQKSCEFDFDIDTDSNPVPKLGEIIDFGNWILMVKQISHIYSWDRGKITFKKLFIIVDELTNPLG